MKVKRAVSGDEGFDLPDSLADSQQYILDLDDVRESADVKFNGRYVGMAWCIPFRLDIRY